MKMQTERQYKIDKYLEMARLTRDGDKRENFIDNAQAYLEMTDSDVTGVVYKVPYIHNVLTKEMIYNKKPSEVYQEYVAYCKETGERTIGRNTFFTEVEQVLGAYRVKTITPDGKRKWVYRIVGER